MAKKSKEECPFELELRKDGRYLLHVMDDQKCTTMLLLTAMQLLSLGKFIRDVKIEIKTTEDG